MANESKEEYNRQYYQKHTKQKIYRDSHKDKIGKYMKMYASVNQDYKLKGLARLRKWDASEKGKSYRKKFIENNLRLINSYKVLVGCLNPHCKWAGGYSSSMLDFHHKNTVNKKFSLAMSGSRSRKAIVEEIAKCTLICSNCHRQVTYENLDSSNFPNCPPLNS